MSDEKIYYLVWSDSRSFYLSRYLRYGFRHVHAFYFTGSHCILLDPSLRCFNVLNLNVGRMEDFIHFYSEQNPEHTILKVNVLPNPDMSIWRLGAISCVSTIQYLLGIYWPLTVTPYALYSRLLKDTPSHIRIIQDGKL